ncbi:MAG TPA: DUF72 domain-containing protein [Rhizomicrobium sp.]
MIRAGIGGWTFEPWRNGVFYPKGLARADELAFAGSRLNTIEINATYHRTQSPASFRKWATETPDEFVFSVKASRFTTNRRVLAEAGPSIDQFLSSGLVELGAKLGPILWQFAPTKPFDCADFEQFLALLPRERNAIRLRHAIEVRHQSFAVPQFVQLARKFAVAIVTAHSDKYPLIGDITADFTYVRLQCARPRVVTGYTSAEIKSWGARAKKWEQGKTIEDLPLLSPPAKSAKLRDVFLYVISGAKERAPAAAMALLDAARA